MESALPAGWTIERVREASQCPTANLRSTDVRVVVEERPDGMSGDTLFELINPAVVIDFAGLFLVRPQGESDWYLGEMNSDQIRCWASCGIDLATAIHAL
jgi:hypothetical protein